MKHIIIMSLTVILFMYSGIAGFAADKIIICGTGDSQLLLRILAKSFETKHPGTTIEVPDSIGSRGGIRATAESSCTLGRAARYLREDEKKYALNYKVFALSPIAFAAHPGIKVVDNLTSRQIIDIYSGKTSSWSELGGDDARIYVANRETGDSSRIVIEEELAGFKDIHNFAGQIIYDTPETVRTIAAYKYTIGYVPLSLAEDAGLTVMKIDGVTPSHDNVLNGKYKYVVPFLIIWKDDLTGAAKEFIDFLFSKEAHKIITDHGAAPVSPRK